MGKTLDDVDVIELNEAFAAQSLAVIKDLDLDPAKVSSNGGAIALGQPIAATGVIITTKILGEMERNDYRLGLVSPCICAGQGIAMLLERDGRPPSPTREQAGELLDDRLQLVQDQVTSAQYDTPGLRM